ncbi:NAD(P)-dependent oxidoreductase [Paenibacillus sp. SI8]|uniref:NAD(P)-dependent oxidoreductase n=1 Tax=unclassified Paenibacillus TaxID=185978 RepID=UPI0034666088
MKRIGWIGIGAMGEPMVDNLLKAGFEVTIYNRTRKKAEDLLARGAKWADSPRKVAESSEVVLTMVTGAAAMDEIMGTEQGLLAGLTKGHIWIDMSTVGPIYSQRIAKEVHAKGANFLEAPVAGSIMQAREASLLILVGGPKDIFDACEPILSVLGRKLFYFGEHGMGNNAKLAINTLLALNVHAISETLVLAEKMGLDREQILELFLDSPLATKLLQFKQSLFVNEEFPPSFSLNLMEKDVGLIMETARILETPLPGVAAAQSLIIAAKAKGKGDLDMTAVFLELKELAALK